MKSFIKKLLCVLSLAWYGALTIFSMASFISLLLLVCDKFFNNNLWGAVAFSVFLIAITVGVGLVAKDKIDRL